MKGKKPKDHKASTKPTVKNKSDFTEEPLAETIRKVSKAIDSLKRSGLNQRAVVVLLADATGVGKKEIVAVLDGLANLERRYCATNEQ
jgi:hypothetical protein